ncbi:MAG: DnaJ domain-containing protein [Anaerolineaceae bacterium]|nr:DnaJ domain-containing protein [Anaerolineaceae bacterium]
MGWNKPSTLRLSGTALVVDTPYSLELVASIKSLPVTERAYDPQYKVWKVAPKHASVIAQWIEGFIGDRVTIPPLPILGETETEKALVVRYVGGCKARADGSSNAFGLVGTEWSVIFPEQVLRNYFGGSVARPRDKQSYFGILGLSQACTGEDVSRTFRRLAFQWHPDRCREFDAAEVFMKIKNAYDVLKDNEKRARYEAGLAFEAKLGTSLLRDAADCETPYGYRAPLRSGKIRMLGIEKLSRFEASKILAWDDVIDSQGRTLITSWPQGVKEPVEE